LYLSPILNFINLLFIAFLANLPLGYLREGSPKYSLRWFLYIHLSIPFIVVIRLIHGFGWEIVPFSIGLAIAGQWFGGKIYRRHNP